MRDNTDNPCLAAGLAYAEFGWTVFPADIITKHPHKAGKYSNGKRWGATKVPAEIKRDFKKWPNAAICIPCGIENGIFVVEADTKEGHDVDGIANLQTLINANSPLPETRMARSPSGSIHYYFTYPDKGLVRNSAGILAPGVDVRGEGGMVVAPPSIKPGVGQYEWLNKAGFKHAPPWLITLVTEKPTKYVPGDPSAPLSKIAEALDILSNDERSQWQIVDDDGVVLKEYKGYDGWIAIALAVYRATSGSDEGFELFDRWCRKNTVEYKTRKTLEHIWYTRFPSCPPIKIGVGSLFAIVDDECPGWQAIWNEEHSYDDDDDVASAPHEARHD
jgi:Bifunctional DNA primase/polymerase, N-terminal/Primase C terminal 2 (PriCT-2)